MFLFYFKKDKIQVNKKMIKYKLRKKKTKYKFKCELKWCGLVCGILN